MRLRTTNQSKAKRRSVVVGSGRVIVLLLSLAVIPVCSEKIERVEDGLTEVEDKRSISSKRSFAMHSSFPAVNGRSPAVTWKLPRYYLAGIDQTNSTMTERSELKNQKVSRVLSSHKEIAPSNKSNARKQQLPVAAAAGQEVVQRTNNRTTSTSSTELPVQVIAAKLGVESPPPLLVNTSQQVKVPLEWHEDIGSELVRPANTFTARPEVVSSHCIGHRDELKTFNWACQGIDLTKVPLDLVPSPVSLQLSNTGIERLTRNSLSKYKDTLRDFSIENALRLVSIEPATFEALIKLRVVYIFQAPKLVSFDLAISGLHPDLTVIRIQRSSLRYWPDLTQFQQERILTSIDLDNNKIHTLRSVPINVRVELLNLEFNRISSIDEFTFNGSEIGLLSLKGNRLLTNIHPNAFANLKNLVKLDLSGTSIQQLPTEGIHQLRSLIVRDTHTLKRIPSIYEFPMLEEAHLTYAYHCCSFRYPKTHDPNAHTEHLHLQEEIDALCVANQRNSGGSGANHNTNHVHSSSTTGQPPPLSSTTSSNRQPVDIQRPGDADFEGTFEERAPPPSTTPGGPVEFIVDFPDRAGYFESLANKTTNETSSSASGRANQKAGLRRLWLSAQNIDCSELAVKHSAFQNISCSPEPDDFNPCEDIMGYPVLRIAVWFVVGASVFGNLSVIVVLAAVFRRLSVPKFLQLNLALGDLVMGFYLATLAFADLTTKGTYFNYAIDWQHGFGCKIAGAASLFASQLSIFTLSVITFERYYTITYSIDLNMRLQLGWAARIMAIGWLYAFASAMLPIFANVNSYSKTSLCLPMRTSTRLDRIFLFVLIFVDSMAFVIIFACYLKMYLLILRQKTEATAKERTVAMRMALLVSTDFACWAPIIFFGTTALLGKPLISVTNSKILIVFFYPLNSMANPFLYVISTRQYKRDLNYLSNRWRTWRRNLFRNKNESYYSNNAYAIAQYPMNNLNAHLGAVAAVTGVANHLHHNQFKPLNECLEHNDQRVVCTRAHQGQYIIRHQILTDKHVSNRASPGFTLLRPSSSCRKMARNAEASCNEFVNISADIQSDKNDEQQQHIEKDEKKSNCLEVETLSSAEITQHERLNCSRLLRRSADYDDKERCYCCLSKCNRYHHTCVLVAPCKHRVNHELRAASLPPDAMSGSICTGSSSRCKCQASSTSSNTRAAVSSLVEAKSVRRVSKLLSKTSYVEKDSSVDILGNISYNEPSSSFSSCSITPTSQFVVPDERLLSAPQASSRRLECVYRNICSLRWGDGQHYCKHHLLQCPNLTNVIGSDFNSTTLSVTSSVDYHPRLNEQTRKSPRPHPLCHRKHSNNRHLHVQKHKCRSCGRRNLNMMNKTSSNADPSPSSSLSDQRSTKLVSPSGEKSDVVVSGMAMSKMISTAGKTATIEANDAIETIFTAGKMTCSETSTHPNSILKSIDEPPVQRLSRGLMRTSSLQTSRASRTREKKRVSIVETHSR